MSSSWRIRRQQRHLHPLQRSHEPGDRTCYEVNIFDQRPDPTYGTGAIVNFVEVDPMPKAGGKWNTFEITAKGRHLVVVLNGQRPWTTGTACSPKGRSRCSTAPA